MSNSLPAVSVLLPVFNGAPYLAEAISSILEQSWGNFELIIINDGSTDGSGDIAKRFADSRIRYFEQKNAGLAATLNRGIGLARGAYIARQDADDISKPERFARQLAYLEANPDCGMVGSWADLLREGDAKTLVLKHPTDSTMIKTDLLFDNPFVHSSIMMRKNSLQEVGGYTEDPARQPPEDYELWSRFARRYDLANLPEALVIYREVPGSISRSADQKYWERVASISSENIRYYLGNDYDSSLIRGAARLYHGVKDTSGQPDAKALIGLLRDLAEVLETRYPVYRDQLPSRLKHFLHIILHSLYSQYVGTVVARYLVLLRSLRLF